MTNLCSHPQPVYLTTLKWHMIEGIEIDRYWWNWLDMMVIVVVVWDA